MIYFDNAATTPLTPSVIEAMTSVMAEQFGNPSSLHTFGRKAKQLLRHYRSAIAQSLKTDEKNIIFTSGGTESNNTAIIGYALANQEKGNHLITTATEHHSVLQAMSYLEKRFGFEVTYLKPSKGHITAQQVRDALRPDTLLVSIMHANNETGDLNPIPEIGQLLSQHSAVFHVDAVQTVGKIAVLPDDWQIDFLSASAHKFHGPKGVGFLYAKTNHFDNLLHGGDQEDKRRASTENMISLAGMATALTEATNQLHENLNHIHHVRQAFLTELEGLDYYINSGNDSLSHVLNIGFPNGNNGLLLTQLDLAGFAVSTGSACTAGAVTPSHVLTSYYGESSPRLRESIRISFGEQNTVKEAQLLAQQLKKLLA
ncbi:cysteine desulfurase family protein [Streptococcus sp. S784/96/1]|uniref:cysteine desulfurase family protein n=1 Tax=Streptococcus sp. S784/96/1 TaxID=2653499 RepID=UPI00138733E4|nr:cysteine desulfurase family protein [Streptococcus sp. S784/96/1]